MPIFNKMMRHFLPFLRKVEKPMVKKGTEEFRNRQERMLKRRSIDPLTSQSVASTVAKVPKYLTKICVAASIPGVAGVIGIAKSDYYEHAYSMYLKVAGYWMALCGTLFGASLTGAEVMKYNPGIYKSLGGIYSKAPRLLFSFAHIPLGLMCMWGCNNENWKGLFGYMLGSAVSTLYFMGGANRKLLPAWLSNLQWPWVFYCQVISLVLVYSLFSKEAHSLKMMTLRKEIQEKTYKPNP